MRIHPHTGLLRATYSRGIRTLIVSSALLLGSGVVRAQSDYSITWSTIDGGGGTSTNSQYSLSGTIGQPDAGAPMTGGPYSLTGGFWSLYAVQTPGAPLLTITLNPQLSTINISWPSPSTGWTLQENTNSVSSANWNDHPFPQDNGTIKYITVSPPTGNRFYRLKK